MANKILIVDDDRATRDDLAQLLTHEGYETVTASDVPTAMHLLGASAPDLLITEIRLDTYNGLHIIAMAPTPIPAIVLTVIADPVIEADARRFGAHVFPGVPFMFEYFLANPPADGWPPCLRRLISAGVADHFGLSANFYFFASLNLLGAVLVYFYLKGTSAMPIRRRVAALSGRRAARRSSRSEPANSAAMCAPDGKVKFFGS